MTNCNNDGRFQYRSYPISVRLKTYIDKQILLDQIRRLQTCDAAGWGVKPCSKTIRTPKLPNLTWGEAAAWLHYKTICPLEIVKLSREKGSSIPPPLPGDAAGFLDIKMWSRVVVIGSILVFFIKFPFAALLQFILAPVVVERSGMHSASATADWHFDEKDGKLEPRTWQWEQCSAHCPPSQQNDLISCQAVIIHKHHYSLNQNQQLTQNHQPGQIDRQ